MRPPLFLEMRVPFTAVLAFLGCIACGDDGQEMAPGRGVGDGRDRRSATEPVSGQVGPPPRGPGAATTSRLEEDVRAPLEAVEASPVTVTERRETENEDRPVRDPSAELRDAIGDPTSCLTEEDRRIGRDISFQVEVDALSSGMVVHARVEAPGVSDEAVECVRRRADRVRFDPFEEHGRTVQTALILRLTPQAP